MAAPLAVVVNETFVRRYLKNVDPLTQHLVMPRFVPGDNGPPKTADYQIVGVFHDVFDDSHLTGKVQPEMFVAQWQAALPWLSIAVRTVAADPATVTRGLQAAVSAVEPTMAIDHVEVMSEVVDRQSSSDRFEMVLLGSFAALALLLAAVGVFGVMSFSVARAHARNRDSYGARRPARRGHCVGSTRRNAACAHRHPDRPGRRIWARSVDGVPRFYGVGAVDFGSLAAVPRSAPGGRNGGLLVASSPFCCRRSDASPTQRIVLHLRVPVGLWAIRQCPFVSNEV